MSNSERSFILIESDTDSDPEFENIVDWDTINRWVEESSYNLRPRNRNVVDELPSYEYVQGEMLATEFLPSYEDVVREKYYEEIYKLEKLAKKCVDDYVNYKKRIASLELNERERRVKKCKFDY